MLKKLKLEIKDVTEKFRSNRKYTSLERVKEVEKIVLTEIHNKDLEQKELLLHLALEIGHPLKVKSIELKEELEKFLQLVLIELINCKENLNKDASEYYQCLEAINDKLYTIVAYKLRQLMKYEQFKFRIPRFGNTQKLLKKKINQLLACDINHSFLQEKRDAEYVEQIRKQYQEKKTIRNLTYGAIFVYFGILFRQKKWFQSINKHYRYALFGFVGAVLFYQLQ
ncbi:unnamed protein product (macronuclear) [Paramecium tetraurelia]|uniref:Uncharacterized protein n=1 Tax=Paramecium tetraurelia TaxID=5888 RepID=A0C9S1_PARTE|nr:uncharacterized protein GSPATT00006845001 [Paramecium tetraurelia]CAK67538.1 unnamed protein product [Paramecium tetraurelia]|eukprot:XP_001434935.1 hypothetical protein (macronuclear) [Paramecium tetraurelia strain d4-2]